MTPATLSTMTWLIIKILTIVGLGLYTVFAIIIVRQEQLMAHVLEESSEPLLRLLSYIHLGVAVATLLLSLVIL